MNIPNLPTDNLYKFMALSGVVIFLFSNIYYRYKSEKLYEEMTVILTETEEYLFEIRLLEEKYKELNIDVEKFKSTILNNTSLKTFNTLIIK